MCQCHPLYARRVSSHRVLYLQLRGSYNICTIYLHEIEVWFKYIIAMFYICHSENPSNITKNNSISIYSWKQISLLTNIRNKFVIRNINLCFFDVMKNSQIFPSKVCPFQYDHSFVFSREMGNIRMYILQNLLTESSDNCFENF